MSWHPVILWHDYVYSSTLPFDAIRLSNLDFNTPYGFLRRISIKVKFHACHYSFIMKFVYPCVVRDPVIGEKLTTQPDPDGRTFGDKHSVAVMKDGMTVGHLPKDISCLAKYSKDASKTNSGASRKHGRVLSHLLENKTALFRANKCLEKNNQILSFFYVRLFKLTERTKSIITQKTSFMLITGTDSVSKY